jgi:hypothetical protein
MTTTPAAEGRAPPIMDARARPRSASRAGRSRRGDRPDSTPPARVAAAPQQRTPKQGARHRNSARIKGHGHLCRFVGMQKGAKPVFRRSPLLSCDILVGGLAGFRSVKLRQSRTGLLLADRTGSQPLARRGRRTRSRHLLVATSRARRRRVHEPRYGDDARIRVPSGQPPRLPLVFRSACQIPGP